MHGSKISYLWDQPRAARGFVSGISLHSHTNQSKETLDFLANLGNQYPLIRPLMARAERYCEEKQHFTLNYSRSYWTPPLTPKLAFELEGRQIENLDIAPLVSITDHDTISAPMLLRTVASARHIPVSTEWTVPFGDDQAFHLGIHNLPSGAGVAWMKTFESFTANPSNARLTELLAALHALPNVLIIFNHPMWDLYLIGEEKHRTRVDEFLESNGEFIHVLELNGLRNWEENRAVKRLAKKWNKLLISGGDRHGVEPNANINLSNAASFTEFVHEVRYEGVSNILFMPQYAQPWKHRILQSTLDAIRNYPEFPQGSRRWDERVYHPDARGVVRPVCEVWRDGKVPPAMHFLLEAVKMMGSRAISGSLKLAWDESRQRRFALEEQEAY
jgi:hypothetical protein